MNLSNFEGYINEKILSRGFDYYNNGSVISIAKLDDNLYKGEVQGTELYTVEVELDNEENIIDTQCDCPYDMGDYCKHQVAVFLALRDKLNKKSAADKQLQYDSADLKAYIPKKMKSYDIEKILSEKSKEELVKFLMDISEEYEEIKQRIIYDFDSENDDDELNKSIKLINSFIRNNSDRHGFVDYDNTDNAVKGAYLVLEKSSIALKNNKISHAFDLAICVIHEMMDLLDCADDSDGIIDDVINKGIDLINEMSNDEKLSKADKENFFNKLLAEASNSRYNGWLDWRLELLNCCSSLVYNPILRSRLECCLVSMIENAKGDSWDVNYLAEKVNLIRYNIVQNYDGNKKAQEFIKHNLKYSSFRRIAIENAMQSKDYEQVIRLTVEGEKNDKNLPGLVLDWKKYHYKALKLSGKLGEQRELAMDFILDGSFEYYKELKSTYDMEEWPVVYTKIILLLENQKKTFYGVYTSILIEEGENQKLLEYVKRNPSSIETYYKYLIPEYKEDVYTIFTQYIEQAAAMANNRKKYKEVCAIIRNLKKAGGKEKALEVKQKLFAKYLNRPAFKDELSKVK